jgi:hypothetical protein
VAAGGVAALSWSEQEGLLFFAVVAAAVWVAWPDSEI